AGPPARRASTDQKSHPRSLRYGAAQIVRIFSGSRQTALQATASRRRTWSASRPAALPRAERLAAVGALAGLQVVEVELHRGVRAEAGGAEDSEPSDRSGGRHRRVSE